MGLTNPPQIRVIYGERNTAVAGHGTANLQVNVQYDTWYDKAQDDITAGITPALAAMGLTYAAGIFTATANALFLLRFGFSPVGDATFLRSAQISGPSYFGSSPTTWGGALAAADKPSAELPDDAQKTMECLQFVAVGETFRVFISTSEAATPDVISYAVLEIYRLI